MNRYSLLLQTALANAERKLQEERATLSRYDEELKALERVIKQKKEDIENVAVELTKKDHDLGSLKKEKAAAESQVAGLEKQYDWIAQEQSYDGFPGLFAGIH